MTLKESFEEKTIKTDSCWPWLGANESTGYGVMMVQQKHQKAHRVSYRLYKGEIPDGLHLDHLCRNRICVNPDHLEAVTNKENVMRGQGACANYARATTCIEGHPFDKVSTRGQRVCLTCAREASRRFRAKRKVTLAV